MRCAAGRVVVALALLPSLAADAAEKARPARVALEFQRKTSARSCPSEKQLRTAVTDILGRPPFDPHARRALRCVLWAKDGTFHAQVQMRDRKTGKRLGVRELSSNDPGCGELGPAVALAIALAVDPLAHPPEAAAPAKSPSVSTGVGVAGAAAAHSVTSAPASRPSPPPGVSSTPPPRPVPAPDLGPGPDFGPEPLAVTAPPVIEAPPPRAPDAGTPSPPVLPLAAAAAAPSPDAGPPPPPAEPLAAAASPDAGPAPEDKPVPEPVPPEPAASAAPSVAGGDAQAWHVIAGAGADWTLGLVPAGGAFGPVVHGGVTWSFASVELEARWLPSTSSALGTGTVSTTLVTGAVVGCALFGPWGACGLLQAGPQTSQGKVQTPLQTVTSTTWVVALGARGQFDWVFAHPVGLRLHLDGLVNLVRPRLVVTNQAGSTVESTAPGSGVALAVGAGVFVVF
jgi:hypothetical protein